MNCYIYSSVTKNGPSLEANEEKNLSKQTKKGINIVQLPLSEMVDRALLGRHINQCSFDPFPLNIPKDQNPQISQFIPQNISEKEITLVFLVTLHYFEPILILTVYAEALLAIFTYDISNRN